MKHLLLALWLIPGQAGEYLQEFHHDFRGRPMPRAGLARQPHNDEFSKIEPEGLRITLPKERKKFGQVGVISTFGVKGDFEITASYQVLHADVPADGFGAGVTMFLQFAEPSGDAAGIYRLVRPKGEQVIFWDRARHSPDKKRELKGGKVPCSADVLRMRMTRKGSTLTYLWAPGTTGDEFHTLEECAFGSDDVKAIALNATSGNRPLDVDVCFLELRVRTSNPEQLVQVARPASPPRSHSWWLFTLGGMAVLFVGAFLVRRLRRRRQPGDTGAAAQEIGSQAAAVATTSAVCPNCGKHLQISARAAGKKVKCPACAAIFTA